MGIHCFLTSVCSFQDSLELISINRKSHNITHSFRVASASPTDPFTCHICGNLGQCMPDCPNKGSKLSSSEKKAEEIDAVNESTTKK